MKRTAIIALALLAALVALGCNNALEFTSLNMDDYDSQYTLERNNPVNVNAYTTTISIAGNLNAINPDATIDVDFYWVSPLVNSSLDIDVLKYSTLDELGPALKKVLKFYSYTDKGDNAANKLIPPTLSSEPLSYNVIKWQDYVATLRFPSLATDISDRIEARLDQYTFTHHNGRQLDMNNDGVIDEYDLIFLRQVTVNNTANTGYGYPLWGGTLIPYNPYIGLGGGDFSYTAPVGATPGFFYTTINPFTFAGTGDTNNYENDLNVIFKLQKFSLDEKKWVNTTGISGNYNNTNGEFRYTINAPETDVMYRVVIENFEALRKFAGKVKFYGYYQRLYSDAFAPASPNEIISSQSIPKEDLTIVYIDRLLHNPFTVPFVGYDDNKRNVVVTLSFVPGDLNVVGSAGLPDPTPYLQNKQIFLGYDGGDSFNPANQKTWNDLVFVPVTIIPYKNNPADTVNNRWKMLLPANYVKNTKTKYLFITTDYKTLGNTGGSNVRTFGNKRNVNFVYNGNLKYEAYSLGSTF